MRNPANWSDAPTADQVARAIVAAARECGADPLDVGSGIVTRGPRTVGVGRARSYAAKALAQVFTSYPRTRIAGMVGCRGLVRQSYFSALDQRLRAPSGVPWWDEAVLARVVEAIGEVSKNSPSDVVENIEPRVAPTPPFKAMRYRPPAGTAAKVLADDDEDEDRPVIDRGQFAGARRQADRPVVSKRQMEADLRAAVERTAAMQPKED